MSKLAKITFTKMAAPKGGVAVILAGEGLSMGPVSEGIVSETLDGGLQRAAEIVAGFHGQEENQPGS